MTIKKATANDSGQMQLKRWNDTGPHIVRHTYTPAAGTAYGVLGLVLADGVDIDTDEAALVAAMTALATVTAVANPRLYGESEASIEVNPGGEDPDTHGWWLGSSVDSSYRVGVPGRTRGHTEKESQRQLVPDGKKWLVCNMVLPAYIDEDASAVTALESALVGVTGITTARYLIGGQIRADAQIADPENEGEWLDKANVKVESRLRIDPLE